MLYGSRMTDEIATISSAPDAPIAHQNTRKVFVKTYGCQMNVYDSDRMQDALAKDGYIATDVMEDADLVLLNTCHIREKAAEKVYSALGRLRELKKKKAGEGREMMIGVAGCVAQAEGDEILRRAPAVDLVIGPQTYHRLPQALERVKRGERVLETDYAIEDKFEHLPAPEKAKTRARGVTAFLTVQEGCDKFCTFCVVPYTRGAEFSRPASQILTEARRMVEAGAREITLLGQNVNAYHGDGPASGTTWGLGRLIRELAEIDGLLRIRYTTSHPRDMDDDLIAAHGDVPALMPFVHLPVQSGSDRILAAMNRKHTADDYRRIIDRMRQARPDLALSSDFIVGFPGERDADFAESLRLITDIGYAQAYSFKYSARPGTPAAGLDDTQVPEAVKTERLASLQQLLNAQQVAFNEAAIGRTMAVLLDRSGKRPGQLMGRSPYMQSVPVNAPQRLAGTVVDVRITAAHANSLAGELVLADGVTAATATTASMNFSDPPACEVTA